MTELLSKNTAQIAAVVVVSAAIVGYFTGLQAPMSAPSFASTEDVDSETQQPSGLASNPTDGERTIDIDSDAVLVATSYGEMRAVNLARARSDRSSLTELTSVIDPLQEFTITPAEKSFALQMREQNRAFNGAPPTMPHPADGLAAESCLICHGDGVRTESFRASRMSHQFLANCTQCHIEQSPRHQTPFEFKESLFVGLPAPTGGPRAFPGAPPQIPHSTWMRVDCMSCHGHAGLQGIRTTHPWRQNCLQCHAPSPQLDQVKLEAEPQFLPAPVISP